MFQLEQKLQEWAARFQQSHLMRGSDIEELQQHLRDSISELTKKGLNEEEAFLVATHRLGEPRRVAGEFGKVNGDFAFGHQLFWMLAGVLFFYICNLAIAAVSELSRIVVALGGGGGYMIGYAPLFTTAVCWIGIFIWLSRLSTGRNAVPVARFLGGWQGKTIVLVFASIVVLCMLLEFGSRAALVQVSPLVEWGRAVWIASIGNSVFALLIPLAFVVAMLAIRRRIRDTAVAL
jgi:hypothetical protein